MTDRPLVYLANWKTYFSYKQAHDWLMKHAQSLDHKLDSQDLLVICPSFEVLETAGRLLGPTRISWGAQDCSAYENGAHTGQVTARSLAELGCKYALVGHSETEPKDASILVQKIDQLILHRITPVICIGETHEERQSGVHEQSVNQRVSEILRHAHSSHAHVLVAYEPIWAIGTGQTPLPADIERIGCLIKRIAQEHDTTCSFIYGGSVEETNIKQLKTIGCLDGLLIGRSSTNVEQLATIVSA